MFTFNVTKNNNGFICQINNEAKERGCSGEYYKSRFAAIVSAIIHYIKWAMVGFN